MFKNPPAARTLGKLLRRLDEKLRDNLPEALARAEGVFSYDDGINIHQFHGIIGSKNNEYTDCIRLQFPDPEVFQARWVRGLLKTVTAERAKRLAWEEKLGIPIVEITAFRLVAALKDPILRDYILTFLERNYYRNLRARRRAKPDESLWSLWFGNNSLVWGLIIAPDLRQGEWVNDVSEIRRAEYKYWTVGHVMQTGIIDPESQEPLRFETLGDLRVFYRSVLKRVSNSIYERRVADFYIEYLEGSPDPLDEPFLIPELRYAGPVKEHVYRLDYAVLNSHTMNLTGFEISPYSTHGHIPGITKKDLAGINKTGAERWAREMAKRNDYYRRFSIPIVTFTDDALADMDQCCSMIRECLEERPATEDSLASELEALVTLDVGEPGVPSTASYAAEPDRTPWTGEKVPGSRQKG